MVRSVHQRRGSPGRNRLAALALDHGEGHLAVFRVGTGCHHLAQDAVGRCPVAEYRHLALLDVVLAASASTRSAWPCSARLSGWMTVSSERSRSATDATERPSTSRSSFVIMTTTVGRG